MSAPVIAAVDGSPASMDAARWAAREARRLGTRLRLVNVCELPPLNPNVETAPLAEYAAVWTESGRRWLDEATELAGAEAPEVSIESEVQLGGVIDTLVTVSAHAAVLVLGSRGFGGLRRLLVGSVAVSVAAHAHCPVVVVHAGAAEADTGPVVVGADGSPHSHDALQHAFRAAAARSARLVAVRAWRDPWLETAWAGPPLGDEIQRMAADQSQALHTDLAALRAQYPDVEVEAKVVRLGRPVDALLEAAEGAALVVVGSHGRGVFSGLLLGSTSHALLHRATCPVAVVRSREPDETPTDPED